MESPQRIPNEVSRPQREDAVALLRSKQSEILRRVISTGDSTTTFIGYVLAQGCLDCLIRSMIADDHRVLYGWISELREYPALEAIPDVLQKSVESILEEVSGAGWAPEAFEPDFLQIAANVELLVEDALGGRSGAIQQAANDVDARIDQLIAQLEINDPPTAEHSRAVSLWCSRIAKRMMLAKKDAVFVKRGGLIHDIGKMKTPKEILHAPRALDDIEWAIMQKHAEDGAEILAEIPELQDLVGVVRGHHERVDGRGYPDRLSGSDIPIGARIITVADSFNAMIAVRPYRRPFSPTVALEELKRHRGTQFDPRVVEAMIEVVSGSDAR